MKILFKNLLILFVSFIWVNCANETEIPVNKGIEGYKQVIKTSKFVCYSPLTTTKTTNYHLLLVYDLPDVEIYITDNDDQDTKSIYSNKSIFRKNGHEICTLYTGLEKVSDGYILNYKKEGGIASSAFLPNTITKASSGQATMDCITDAYSNHGWVSVWISVQSAFLPETAVAIAAACALNNI